MPFIGNQPALSFTSFAKQDFTTSATTSYTLDNPVANANELALFINFVRQEPTTAYSASGTTLTLTEATSSSDDMYCVYLGKAVQTVNPPNASVGTSQLASSLDLSSKTVTLASNMTNTPAFAVRLSADQTNLTDNNNVLVHFDTIEFDTDNAFDTSAGNYSFTVPSGKAGTYCLICNLHFKHSGQINHNDTYIFKNGVALRGVRFNSSAGDYEDEGSEIITTIETLAVGDVINIYGRANSGDGTNTTLDGGTALPACFFRGFKLIGV